MNNLEQTRSAILQKADVVSSKRRFGLFSQPPLTTAVGDESLTKLKYVSMSQRWDEQTCDFTPKFSDLSRKKEALSKSYFGPLNRLPRATNMTIFWRKMSDWWRKITKRLAKVESNHILCPQMASIELCKYSATKRIQRLSIHRAKESRTRL